MNTAVSIFKPLVLLALGLGVAGCQSHAGNGALLGGAIGAATGGIIGSYSHGRAGEGALIGGAIGAAAGGLIGHEMDNQERIRHLEAERAYGRPYYDRPPKYERYERYDRREYAPPPPPPPGGYFESREYRSDRCNDGYYKYRERRYYGH